MKLAEPHWTLQASKAHIYTAVPGFTVCKINKKYVVFEKLFLVGLLRKIHKRM